MTVAERLPAHDPVHCKAKGKRMLTLVGSTSGRVIDLAARDESVYVLAFEDALRRASLVRISRDGTRRVVIARHEGPSVPKSFLLTSDAAYFTRQANVIRMRLATGEVTEVIHDFVEAIAVAGEYVYGVSCKPNAPADSLVRVSLVSGEREVVTELPRVPAGKRASSSPPCDYHYVAVDEQGVFLSDWAGRRIVSASPKDKSLREVAFAGSYPMRITLEPGTIVFQAEGGLYRAPRQGGKAERLAQLANTPFTTYVADETDFWINQSEAYTDAVWIHRLARTAGKPRKVLRFEGYQDCPYPCAITDGIAVDDECLYVAHREEHSVSLFAWPKE